jgi:hypothetical protein
MGKNKMKFDLRLKNGAKMKEMKEAEEHPE